jgi:hypothetical protein
VRVGGDFITTQFVEVKGAEAVEREIHRVLGGVSMCLWTGSASIWASCMI